MEEIWFKLSDCIYSIKHLEIPRDGRSHKAEEKMDTELSSLTSARCSADDVVTPRNHKGKEWKDTEKEMINDSREVEDGNVQTNNRVKIGYRMVVMSRQRLTTKVWDGDMNPL
jgi:hypothetical protein